MRIYKYKIETTDTQVVELPIGSEILTIQTQNGSPCLWAMVNEKEDSTERRTIDIFGTGHNIDSTLRRYIGTYQLHDGGLVFHCFERINN